MYRATQYLSIEHAYPLFFLTKLNNYKMFPKILNVKYLSENKSLYYYMFY
jgi:hypothetical protein